LLLSRHFFSSQLSEVREQGVTILTWVKANYRSDRLGILELVLRDELKTLQEFEQAISGKAKDPPLTQNKVLMSHLERIQKMNELATNTYQAVSNLSDLDFRC
jgi:hypothetical protein